MARKPGRPQSNDEILSQERILSTALAMIDEQGVDSLSMRRLAAALEVNPMALYHYFENKEAIIRGMIRRIFTDYDVPQSEHSTWEAEVRAYAHAYYRIVAAHPQLIIHIVANPELVELASVAANNEQIYAALFRAGLTPLQVFHATSVIVDYLHGCLLAEPAMQAGESPESHTSEVATLPYTQQVMAALKDQPIQRVYSIDTGLDMILAGIKTLINRP